MNGGSRQGTSSVAINHGTPRSPIEGVDSRAGYQSFGARFKSRARHWVLARLLSRAACRYWRNGVS